MELASDNQVTYFGQTNYRDTRTVFGIRKRDRRSHIHIIGKTGVGKSTLLEMFIRQDVQHGEGFALFDPHGDLYDRVIACIPDERRGDVIDFNVPRAWPSLGFNPLAGIPVAKRSLAASGILGAFKKIWKEFWGPRLEHILRHALLALLDQPRASLADILRLFEDAEYRKRVAHRTSNARVRSFWLKEFPGYTTRLRAEAIAPIQNKIGAFLAHPILGHVLTQTENTFNLSDAMEQRKMVLINLSKGQLGEDASYLLGSLLVSLFEVAALSRASIPQEQRADFTLYLDEFHTITTPRIGSMLAELRKYRVPLVLAHQYLDQLEGDVANAILGNVGTVICFRLGAVDAKLMEQEFQPVFSARDISALPNLSFYLRLMIDGVISKPFSADLYSV